jgi:DNA-binding transcriptional MerR regulator
MTYSRLEDLAAATEAWAAENQIRPLSGQAGEVLTLRNLRYYRALGLIDGPVDGAYTEKHFLQLAAVRVLQAHGQPLKVIQQLLFGRSEKELKKVLKDGVAELTQPVPARSLPSDLRETWSTFGLSDDWLLISRRGQTPSADQLRQIAGILAGTNQIPSVPPSPSVS